MRPWFVLTLYNLLLPFGLLVLLPASIVKMRRRGGYGSRFWQRFGRFDPETAARLREGSGRSWWLHAVSVGEVNVARKLIAELLRRDPSLPVILSVTTSTGYAVATNRAPDNLTVIYSPVDLPPVVSRVLRLVRPSRLVLVEAEVWPNLVARAKASGIPVALVNARLSPRSESRYRRFRALAAPVFGMLDQVLVQDAADAGRWEGIGARPAAIRVTGSVKFDPAGSPAACPDRLQSFRSLLASVWPSLPGARFVLLASTHEGEEAALARVLIPPTRELTPPVRLLIAPRHAERRHAVRAALEAAGFTAALRSAPDSAPRDPDVLVIDSTGELREWQAIATAVVIGKSFLATGGQNPAEAIDAGIPVVTGPHMENFRPIMNHLVAADGIRQVPDVSALPEAVVRLLTDPAEAQAQVSRAAAALERHRGATGRTAALLLNPAAEGAEPNR